MQKLITVAFAAVATAISAQTTTEVSSQQVQKAPAGEEVLKEEDSSFSIGFELEADFFSAYVWRGQICSHLPVFQPSPTIYAELGDYGLVYVNAWMNYNLSKHYKPTQFAGLSEIDYEIGYEKEFDSLSFAVGNVWYTYPHQSKRKEGPSTCELFVKSSYKNDFIVPSVSWYWDYSKVGGNDSDAMYFEFRLSREFSITDDLTFELGAATGLANGAYLEYYSDGELNDSQFVTSCIDAKATYKINDNLSIGASLGYHFQLSHTVRHSEYDCRDDYNQILVGGLNAKLEF